VTLLGDARRRFAVRHAFDCGRWLADRAGWGRYLWEIWRCQFPTYVPLPVNGRHVWGYDW
jgi:hypothetical protein